MVPLASKVNVDSPSTAYPFGNVRNNPGDNSGTPVDVNLVGDAMQFFEALMVNGGITPNGNPDSATYGFQLLAALSSYIISTVSNLLASTTQIGVARFATPTEAATGTAVDLIINPLALAVEKNRAIAAENLIGCNWSSGAVLVTPNSGTVTLSGAQMISWVIIPPSGTNPGKTMVLGFDFGVAVTSGTVSSLQIAIPASANVGGSFYGSGHGYIGTGPAKVAAVSGDGFVTISFLTGSNLSGSVEAVSGQITIQLV